MPCSLYWAMSTLTCVPSSVRPFSMRALGQGLSQHTSKSFSTTLMVACQSTKRRSSSGMDTNSLFVLPFVKIQGQYCSLSFLPATILNQSWALKAHSFSSKSFSRVQDWNKIVSTSPHALLPELQTSKDHYDCVSVQSALFYTAPWLWKANRIKMR